MREKRRCWYVALSLMVVIHKPRCRVLVGDHSQTQFVGLLKKLGGAPDTEG